MSRKKELASQTENDIFATRLRETMKKRGLSQNALAAEISKKCGATIQRQSISQYMLGQSKPDTERLAAICKALGVSADYLIGLSDETVPVPKIKAASKITGLSEAAICALAFANKTNFPGWDWDAFIQKDSYPTISRLAAQGINDLLSVGGEKVFSALFTIKECAQQIKAFEYPKDEEAKEYRASQREAARLGIKLRLAILELTESAKDSAEKLCNYREALSEIEKTIESLHFSEMYHDSGVADYIDENDSLLLWYLDDGEFVKDEDE